VTNLLKLQWSSFVFSKNCPWYKYKRLQIFNLILERVYTRENWFWICYIFWILVSPTGRGSMKLGPVEWKCIERLICSCSFVGVLPFLPVLRIRNKNFGSGFGSGSGVKLVSGSEFESGFESRIWIRIRILDSDAAQKQVKLFFYPASSSNIKRLSSTNKVHNKLSGFGSGSIGKRHGSADPDPYQCKCEICIIVWNYLISAWQ
jgi:hypothetical protein